MKLSVVTRRGRQLFDGGLEISDSATIDDLQQKIYGRNKKWHPNRQRLTVGGDRAAGVPPVVLDNGSKRVDDFVKDGDTILFKDLGPQVGWTTVFFWEYFGPLAVYPLFYYYPEFFYPTHSPPPPHARAQDLALIFWSLHYAKRIAETFFVHKYSHGTMPLRNLFKNCGYYWGFTAFVSYFVNHPLYTPVSDIQLYIGVGLGVISELSNLYCHLILATLRTPGSKEYVIPKGFLFNFVTTANYTTEIYAWLGFNIATQTVAGYLFMAAGAYQMAVWAIGKHKRLRRIFDGTNGKPKYPRRYIMLPPFF